MGQAIWTRSVRLPAACALLRQLAWFHLCLKAPTAPRGRPARGPLYRKLSTPSYITIISMLSSEHIT
eukprot:COSAG01_NODE_7759_length_3065_cov_2.277871_4_plen_67_part_00